jgi:hypothetical protein
MTPVTIQTRPPCVRTSAMTIMLCERVRLSHFMATIRQFAPIPDELFTSTKHLMLNSSQFCCFLLRFEGTTMQKMKGLVVRASATRVCPILQHPVSSLTVHPFSLCAVSHTLPPLDTHNLLWILFSIQQSTSPYWLPLHVRWSQLCFSKQFNSITAEFAEYLPKRPL